MTNGNSEALAKLLEGNARFVAGKSLHTHTASEYRAELTSAQHPFAAIIACSDSRVPVELVFDQGFGDLFVIRVAGNVVSPDVVGSLQYAGAHLHVPLVMVLGHKRCGAVEAALRSVRGLGEEARYIRALVRLIEPGIEQVDSTASWDAQIDAAVELNVRWTMKQLTSFPEAREALEQGRVALVGAIYDLESGRVDVLET